VITLPPSNSTKTSLGKSTKEYRGRLAGSVAEEYLLGRSLSKTTMERFSLGFTGSDPLDGHPRNRISIPYVTRSGVVQIRFRTLEEDSNTKYLPVTGTPVRLFNTTILTEGATTVYLTEGEMDAITACQMGLPAVGVPGVSAWKKSWGRPFQYRDVRILADNDDTGQGLEFANKITPDLWSARVVLMPHGHDLNSFYQKEGEDGVRAWIDSH